VTLRIRPAIVADAPAMARVHIDSWRWAYTRLMPRSYLEELSVPRRTRHWAAFIGDAHTAAMAWVAYDQHGCCGLASAGPTRGHVSLSLGRDAARASNVGEVHTLYVSERAAGRGVGHALIAYTVAQLKATAHSAAILWVLEDNHRARRFYEREGWRHDGARRQEDVASLSLSAVRYQRAL
jgi:GNAT superfamily N-acetyltransferase